MTNRITFIFTYFDVRVCVAIRNTRDVPTRIRIAHRSRLKPATPSTKLRWWAMNERGDADIRYAKCEHPNTRTPEINRLVYSCRTQTSTHLLRKQISGKACRWQLHDETFDDFSFPFFFCSLGSQGRGGNGNTIFVRNGEIVTDSIWRHDTAWMTTRTWRPMANDNALPSRSAANEWPAACYKQLRVGPLALATASIP